MYAVRPKGKVAAAAAEDSSVCDAYTISKKESRLPCSRQVTLQRVATPLLYTLTGQAHSKNESPRGKVHKSSART